MPRKPPSHRPPGWRPPQQSQKDYDRRRSGAKHRKLYNSRWNKYSKDFRARNPLCAECVREGRTGAAEVVDHIVPHKGDEKLFWDENNHQSLCIPHHNRKSPTERNGGKVE